VLSYRTLCLRYKSWRTFWNLIVLYIIHLPIVALTLSLIMSSSHSITPYLVGALIAAFVLGCLTRRNTRNDIPLPPGPKPFPFIGNLLDMPKEKDWETYRAWNERYGDIVYVETLGTKIVVLSSAAVISELFEWRSTTYSDRPSTVMAVEMYDRLSPLS
jgi:hypothetical protein